MGEKKTCKGRTPQHRQLELCVQKTPGEDWIPGPADLPTIRHKQRTTNETCRCQHATRLRKPSLELNDAMSRVCRKRADEFWGRDRVPVATSNSQETHDTGQCSTH